MVFRRQGDNPREATVRARRRESCFREVPAVPLHEFGGWLRRFYPHSASGCDRRRFRSVDDFHVDHAAHHRLTNLFVNSVFGENDPVPSLHLDVRPLDQQPNRFVLQRLVGLHAAGDVVVDDREYRKKRGQVDLFKNQPDPDPFSSLNDV